jgi:hypothetical protein
MADAETLFVDVVFHVRLTLTDCTGGTTNGLV